MTTPQTKRKPTFFWQAALILLPVAVLAMMGWFSLRQDKILAEHDATERAQSIADDLLPKIWDEITAKVTGTNELAFEVDAHGQLIYPPPRPVVPDPKPFDLTKLNTDQSRLWNIFQHAGLTPQTNGLEFEDFIASGPPENFAAIATYERSLQLIRERKLTEAAEMLDRMIKNYPEALGESGLPLKPLAELKLFEIEPRPKRFPLYGSVRGHSKNSISGSKIIQTSMEHFISVDSLCSNLVYHPLPLTSFLLSRISDEIIPEGELIHARRDPYQLEVGTDLPETVAAIQKWRRLWAEHELLRKLYRAAQPHLRPIAGAVELDSTDLLHMNSLNPSAGGYPLFWLDISDHAVRPMPDGSWSEMPYDNWLAVRSRDDVSNQWFVCRSDSEIRSLANLTTRIPEFFGVGIKIGGASKSAELGDHRLWWYRSWANPHSEGGGLKKEFSQESATNVLASATKMEGGLELLRVAVYLTNPAALYQRQKARAFWFGALILISTIAALVGLTTAWRAFRRQLQLSEMKSNFVSSVSHELRAPIASVRLMAENLEREKISEPQKQKEYFAFIGQECRRLTSLIENVLDFSRIEQGRKRYEFEPTDIVALVMQTVKLMEPYATEKGVKLETSNAEHRTPNIELDVDGRAIQQALVNLIDNAIKHSPKGEGVVVKTEPIAAVCGRSLGQEDARRSQTAATMEISVSDHGAGIPADEQEKIFERFYRRGSELRRETQGVGIGLNIVKHIVEAHEGRVRVESEVGKGSRFTIELPVNHRDTEEQK